MCNDEIRHFPKGIVPDSCRIILECYNTINLFESVCANGTWAPDIPLDCIGLEFLIFNVTKDVPASPGEKVCLNCFPPKVSDCGTISHNLEPLIFEGVKEKFGEAPWHAAIYKQMKDEKELICGGTIVSSYAIISGRINWF